MGRDDDAFTAWFFPHIAMVPDREATNTSAIAEGPDIPVWSRGFVETS
jgi:hypothetical protein